MSEYLGRFMSIDIEKIIYNRGGMVPYENAFSPVDAKYAQTTLEEVGKFASWEQLYSLCKQLLNGSLSKWTKYEAPHEFAIYTVIDWAQSVSASNATLGIERQETTMSPQITINNDFDWFQRNYKNLKKKYSDKWIAIANQEIISIGDSFIDALSVAREKGSKRPFITKVSAEGWGQK